MSGIAGILTTDGTEPPEEILHALSAALRHRGQDDQGIAVQNGLGLVHQRFAISPLDAGHQPLSNDSKLSLVTDCCLLKTQELKEQFSETYSFTTALESEVIFPLYEKYGAEFTHYLSGVYSIALYDGHANELILTRDPTGVKPLFYFTNDKFFIFASELKVLLGLDIIQPHIESLARKEALQYGATLGGKTLIRDIKAVLPGQTLIVQDGRLLKTFQDRPFDDLKPRNLTLKRSFKEIPAALCEALTGLGEAPQKMACVLESPGDYLLGSTLMQCYQEDTQCFSFLLEGQKDVEGGAVGLDSLEEISITEQDFWGTLPFLAAALDEPCNMPERALTYYAAKEINPECRVLVSALGSQVLTADLAHFKNAKRFKFFGGRLWDRRGIFQPLRDTPLFLHKWQGGLTESAQEIVRHSSLSRLQQSQILEYENRFVSQGLASFERVIAFHGFEAKFPFLDPKIRYELMGMGDALKIHYGQTGYAFYELLRHAFPGVDLSRLCHFKRSQLNQWLRQKGSRLAALVAHQEEIEAIFSRDFVRAAFSCKDASHTQAAWTLLLFALWHQAHIKGIKPVPDTLSFLSAKS